MIKISMIADGYNNNILFTKPDDMTSYVFSDSVVDVFCDEIFQTKEELNEKTFQFPSMVVRKGNNFFKAMSELLDATETEDYIFDGVPELENKYKEYKESIKRIKEEYDNLKKLKEIKLEDICKDDNLAEQFEPYDFQISHAAFALQNKKSSNFSSPGSGKTITASVAIANLFEENIRDFLVVGPKSARVAWMKEPKDVIDNNLLDSIYITENTDMSINFMKGYQSLENSSENGKIRIWFINIDKLHNIDRVNNIFKHISKRKYGVIVDEAHYFKNDLSAKHNNINELLTNSSFTLLLTGSPFPKDKSQGTYIPKMLFPGVETDIDFQRMEVEDLRVKLEKIFVKKDKNKVNEIKPMKKEYISFKENPIEKYMMDQFNRLTNNYLDKKSFDQWDKSIIIRLMQATSSPKSLLKPLNESIEEIEGELEQEELEIINENRELDEDVKVAMQRIVSGSKVKSMIDSYEMSKDDRFLETIKIIKGNISERILIWNVFRKSSQMLQNELEKEFPNKKVWLIDGNVVNQDRENILNSFKNTQGSILIASPATIAESVSLHNEVNIAIYYFRNYVGSHWMQSRDRIHRLVKPGSTTYDKYSYVLKNQQENSVDNMIDINLTEKTKLQSDLID